MSGSSERLSFNMKAESDFIIVEVIGDIDIYTMKKAELLFSSLQDRGIKFIVASLDNANYIDSSGISLFLTQKKLCERKKGKFIIICNNESILKLLRLSRIEKIIPVTSNVSETKEVIQEILDDYSEHLKLTRQHLKKGNIIDAIKIINLALASHSDKWEVLFLASEVFFAAKKEEKAIKLAKKAYELEKEDEDLLMFIAMIYSNEDKIDEAKEIYKNIIKTSKTKNLSKAREKLELLEKLSKVPKTDDNEENKNTGSTEDNDIKDTKDTEPVEDN